MTNALFNDNRLKLGVFGLNVSNGCAATTAEGHLEPTWQNNVAIAVMADRAGIEAVSNDLANSSTTGRTSVSPNATISGR